MPLQTSPAADLEAEVAALRERVAALESGSPSEAAFRYLDAMERVGAVLHAGDDLELVLENLLDELLDLFACDRAWLLHPVDPDAPSWSVPMERTRAQWPGAFALGVQVPMDEPTAALFQEALDADGPLAFDPSSGRVVPPDIVAAFHIQTQLLMAFRPRVGRPWMLGVHHCGRSHVFTKEEIRIFDGIGRRVADALGTLLLLRDLGASEARYRTLVEHSPDAIMVMDTTGRLLDANGRLAELLGLSQDALPGSRLQDHCPALQPGGRDTDGFLSAWLADARAGWSPRFELLVHGADGQPRETEVRLVLLETGSEQRIQGSMTDLSARRSLELQVAHLQKMEALGELAGGVAHDLNNQLVIILCYAEMLADASSPTQAATLSDRVLRAASDAASLTSQLLAFSRRTAVQPEAVDLDDLVTTAQPLLERVLGEGVGLELRRSGAPAPALVDLQQVEQVLVNLVTNARDALPEGGTVRITTGVQDLAPDLAGRLGISPGRYASLVVQDDGVGISADALDRLFEPFFTTKERGRGTGLGLSTAQGVVTRAGGAIDVDSSPGAGSSFSVYLPVASTDELPATEAAEVREVPGGSERVLVVEGHDQVGRVARNILREAGYDVHRVRTAAEAEALVAGGARFDLLVTEVLLGRDDGVALAAALRRRQPTLRVLFTTSFSARAISRFTHSPKRVVLLQKPWSPDGLLARVRRALDGDPGGEE